MLSLVRKPSLYMNMATLLDGKLYVKTFSMLHVDCSNGHVLFIVKIATDRVSSNQKLESYEFFLRLLQYKNYSYMFVVLKYFISHPETESADTFLTDYGFVLFA